MKEVKPAIGGQAVIEGVMMRGPKSTAIAVRKDNGEIVLKKDENHSISERYKFLKLPILRGVVSLIEMMIIGIQTLSYSATMAGYEEEETLTTKDIAIALASAVQLLLSNL